MSVTYANNSKSLVPILSLLLFDESNVSSIEFSASTNSEWEGYEVELSALLIDRNGNSSPISDIVCESGTLINSTFTLPQIEQDTNVSCSAIAVDSQGNDLSASLEIEAKAISLMPSKFQLNYAAGRGMVFDYRGPITPQIEEGAKLSINNQSLDVSFFNNQIVAFLPVSIIGNQSFQVSVGQLTEIFSVFIEGAPTIDSPQDYLSQYISDLLTSIDVSENPEYQQIVDDLQSAQLDLLTLSETELQSLALFVKQNVEDIGTGDLLSNSFKQNGVLLNSQTSECLQALTRLSVGLGTLYYAAPIAAVSIKAGLVTGPGAIPAGIIAGASIGAVLVAARISINAFSDTYVECFKLVSATLDSIFPKDSTSKNFKPLGAYTQLVNGEQGEFRIELEEQIFDLETRNGVLGQLTKFRSLLEEFNVLAGGLLDSIIAAIPTGDSRFSIARSDEVFIKSISDSNVMGTLSQGEGDKLNVVFEFIDLVQVPVETASSSFDIVFGLVDTELEVPIRVKLAVDVSPDLEVSIDDEILESDSTFNFPSGQDLILVKVKNNGFLEFDLDSIVVGSNDFVIERLFSDVIQSDEFEYFRVRYIGTNEEPRVALISLSSTDVSGYEFSFNVLFSQPDCKYHSNNGSYTITSSVETEVVFWQRFWKDCQRYNEDGSPDYLETLSYYYSTESPNGYTISHFIDYDESKNLTYPFHTVVYSYGDLERGINSGVGSFPQFVKVANLVEGDINFISYQKSRPLSYSPQRPVNFDEVNRCKVNVDVELDTGGLGINDYSMSVNLVLSPGSVPEIVIVDWPALSCTGKTQMCINDLTNQTRDSGYFYQCMQTLSSQIPIEPLSGKFPVSCSEEWNHVDEFGVYQSCPLDNLIE